MGQGHSKWDDYGPVQPDGTGDLSPIEPKLRNGLQIIGTLAVLSLILCTSLFLFITYRLVEGRVRRCGGGGGGTRRNHRQSILQTPLTRTTTSDLEPKTSLNLPSTPASPGSPYPYGPYGSYGTALRPYPSTPQGLRSGKPERFLLSPIPDCDVGAGEAVPNIRQRYKGYHPLLVLIYMLLIADIIQSASFIPNLVWVRNNAITVRSDTCWGQGWLRSQGDMASSLFAAAVSINTYIMVVRRHTIPSKTLWSIVGTIWSFSFLIVALGVWSAQNGKDHGGYFVRVDTWCWISSEFATTRLWTHFIWVLACFAVILIAYLTTAVTFYMRSRPHNGSWKPRLNPFGSGHHPAFLIYPLVYFICCIPMALGPMILLAGVNIKQDYFLFAGAMIASNGWLDVIIWSSTMIFLAPKDIKEAGLEDFRFLRTNSVKYGNLVWVEGGQGQDEGSGRGSGPSWRPTLGWGGKSKPGRDYPRGARGGIREDTGRMDTSRQDAGQFIQIERSTMVVVEDNQDPKRYSVGNAARRVSDIVSVPKRVAHLF